MSARFSHANCAHPSTKVARAACRRAMKKATIASVVSTAFEIVPKSPIITAWESMINGPRELEMAPIVVTPAQQVTSENWREFSTATVRALLNDDDETTVSGTLTGWGSKLVQIKTEEKLVRIPAGDVAYVAVING